MLEPTGVPFHCENVSGRSVGREQHIIYGAAGRVEWRQIPLTGYTSTHLGNYTNS